MAPTLIMLLLMLPAAPLAACAGAGAPLGSVDNLSCHSPVVSASRHRSVIFFICRVASLVGGPSGSNEKQPIMKNGLSYRQHLRARQSADWDIYCIRADARPDGCCTITGNRASIRCSGNAAASARCRAAIGRSGDTANG